MSMSQPSDAEHEWWRVDLVLQTILCPVRFGENITACSGMLIPSGEHIQKSACHNQSGNPPPGHHHNELVTLAKCWTSRSCHSFIGKHTRSGLSPGAPGCWRPVLWQRNMEVALPGINQMGYRSSKNPRVFCWSNKKTEDLQKKLENLNC